MNKLILFISFLTSTVCFSQQVTFEHLTQNEGLPSPTVTSITKDSYGFMWFGTRKGLVKYDGYDYTTFNQVIDKNGEKESNFFFSDILQLNDSILLVALSYSGIYAFNLITEKFTLQQAASKKDDGEKK